MSILANVQVENSRIPDVKLIRTRVFFDSRGWFGETYHRQAYVAAGITDEFVQDNFSSSTNAGTVRGLHFQMEPFAQAKLVRVIRGRIFDVAVDLRRGSLTYGQHVAFELSSGDGRALYIPVGFAHGFCTMEPETEVHYKVSAHYSQTHEGGLAWNDPELGIDWPLDAAKAVLSDKDCAYPRLSELPPVFTQA